MGNSEKFRAYEGIGGPAEDGSIYRIPTVVLAKFGVIQMGYSRR